MKYLKSTTDKSYTAEGKIIPAISQSPLAVTEEVYNKITSMSVIKSLIKTGGILVLDKYSEPVSSDAATARLRTLTSENARLQKELKELKTTATESATVKQVKAAQKAQAAAEAELAELKEKYAALEKEANEKIAELSN